MAKLVATLIFVTVIGVCVANGVLEEVHNATSEVKPAIVSTTETIDTTTQGDLEGPGHGTQEESKKNSYKPRYGLRDDNGTCVCYAGQVINGPSVDWLGKNGGGQPPFRMFCGPKCCYCEGHNETDDAATVGEVEGHGTQEESKEEPYKPRYGLRSENGTCMCYAGQVLHRPSVDWTGKNGGGQPPFRMFCGPKCCYCDEIERNEARLEEHREKHMRGESHLHGERVHHWGPGRHGPNNGIDSGKFGKDSPFDGERINHWGPGAGRDIHPSEREVRQMGHGPTYRIHPREHRMRQMEHGPPYRMHPREQGMRQMGHGPTYRMHPRRLSKPSRGMHSLLKDMLSYGDMAPGMHLWSYDY